MENNWKKLSGLLMPLALLALAGCMAQSDTVAAEADSFKSVLVEDVPHVRQKPDFCGEACIAMYLRKLGHDVDQDFVFDHSGLDPKQARGCFTKELFSAAERIGFDPGNVWYRVNTKQADAGLQQMFGKLHADLAAGNPAVLCTRFSPAPTLCAESPLGDAC